MMVAMGAIAIDNDGHVIGSRYFDPSSFNKQQKEEYETISAKTIAEMRKNRPDPEVIVEFDEYMHEKTLPQGVLPEYVGA